MGSSCDVENRPHFLAADCMNDWYKRCAIPPRPVHLRRLSCNVCGQQDFGTSALGSAPTNAARGTDTRFRMANGGTVRQDSSEIDTLSDAQGVFEFHAKVAYNTIDLCVTK
ncbi:hypothetical protein DFP92_1038 [Yoonia sediminilitoris]|uniref:Uncharacterized protein n=1 Tax=Yoonia sediminilitoris TaxID=1286148 RepID=A0A2T6KJN1_9RHOB|nr:hypothetical protein C8N45_1038 [Yoonia sediminilitoris]RCW96505.1 hypothetical protein DFP92_1038 [Yoonia sediminilitoris]